MNSKLASHPNHDANDLAYLRAKGWKDAEILKRWTEERAAGGTACRWNGIGAAAKLRNVLGR